MKHTIGFAMAGNIMTMIFLMLVNIITYPNTLWFIYPCLLLIFWPGSVYFAYKRQYLQFSIFGSTVLILFFIIENLLNSPEHLWFLYVVYPILRWPIGIILGRKLGALSIAITGSMATIFYYGLLNITMSPGYLWFIYPAFAVLWWPLAVYHGKRKTFFTFSIYASILIGTYFIVVNIVLSPGTIWAVYPIFCVLWWPLSMYFYIYKRRNI